MENDHSNHNNGENGEIGTTDSDANRQLGKIANESQAQIERSQDGESEGGKQIERSTSHTAAIEALALQLGEARSREVAAEQRRIDEIEETGTLARIAERGELSAEDSALKDALAINYGRNVSLMTPEEARGLHRWVSDANQDVKDAKAEVVADMITRTLEGKRSRRDQGTFANLEALNHKFVLWERGEIDTSAGFDTTPYIPGAGEGFGDRHSESIFGSYDEEYDKGAAYEDFDDDARYNEAMIQDYIDGVIDEEELADLIDFDPDDRYVYGPFTMSELSELSDLSWRSYVDATDFRVKSSAGRLLDSAIPARSNDVMVDLGNYYVGEQIASGRRLQARDLVSAAASLGLELRHLLPKDHEGSKASEEAKRLRRSLGWCSYYMARICQINLNRFDGEEFREKAHDIDIPEGDIDMLEPVAREIRENARNKTQNRQLRHRYGRARPVSSAFFSEVLDRSESWTEREAAEKDRTYNPYLLKLDMWLTETEADYKDLLRANGGPDGSTMAGTSEIPDIFNTISVGSRPQLPADNHGESRD